MKFVNMSKTVLENIGGVENITNVTHCATRLRISYKNKKLVDEEAIKGAENVVGLVSKDKQIQIIIGPNVTEAYNDFLDISKWTPGGAAETGDSEEESENKNFMYYMNKVGNFCASSFMPDRKSVV